LRSAKKSLEVQINKSNQDFDIVNTRKQKDLQTLDKLQDIKQIQAVQEELDHVFSRIKKVEDKQMSLMESQEQIDQNLAKVKYDLDNVTSQINQFEDKSQEVLKIQRDKEEYLSNFFDELAQNLSGNLLQIFNKAAEENYGRAVVFYSAGNFEGLITPLTAEQQQEINNIRDSQVAVLADTNQIVVKISLDEVLAIKKSL
jgi:predicted  nucleic acid-binding Zn-ribbon protein